MICTAPIQHNGPPMTMGPYNPAAAQLPHVMHHPPPHHMQHPGLFDYFVNKILKLQFLIGGPPPPPSHMQPPHG